MIGGASGCGLCPWSSSRKVGAYALPLCQKGSLNVRRKQVDLLECLLTLLELDLGQRN